MAAPRHGSNRQAVDGTLGALKDRLSPEHDALVQLLRSLADAVDADPRNASLWREYRGAVTDLGRIAQAAASDGFADLVGRLRSEVGDATN